MHKFIYVFFVLSLLVIGCTEESNILSPIDAGTNEVNINNTNEPNWIGLPASEDLSLRKDASVSQWVYGNQETLLEINTGYAGGPYGWISITAHSRFQRYSFTGSRYITMSVNDEFGTATFSPSGTFLKPVIYNLTIVGVDLSNVNPSTVRFVYMAADGSYQTAQCDGITVDKQAGKLVVLNARLPHFSRYGFVN